MEEKIAKTGNLPEIPLSVQSSVQTGYPVNRGSDEEIEIDLLELFQAVRRRILVVLLCGLIAANISALVTRFLIPAKYTSTSKMLVLSKETTISSLADLQIGSQLTNDYTILIQSRPVLQEVVDNLHLDISYKTLRNRLTVTNPNSSRILEISIVDRDPQLAKEICDEVSTVAANYISEKMEVSTPSIIEEGEIPLSKSSPSMSRNVLIGFLLGALLAIALICIAEIMNDSIVTEEDVERYLGLSTLASIPDKEQGSSGSKKRKKRGKSGKQRASGGRRS